MVKSGVKKLVLILVLLYGWTAANAQDITINGNFGIRFDLLIPGIHLGIEVGIPEWQLGVRGAINLLIIVNLVSVDAYLRYRFAENWSLYLGGGKRWYISPITFPSDEWHGLLGVQYYTFFIEIQPGIIRGTTCGPIEPAAAQNKTPACGSSKPYETFSFFATLGWSWRF